VSSDQEARNAKDGSPSPACQATDEANYVTESDTGGLLAFHDPCGYSGCFPGDDCPDMGQQVLRARGTSGNKLHRPAADDGGDA